MNPGSLYSTRYVMVEEVL